MGASHQPCIFEKTPVYVKACAICFVSLGLRKKARLYCNGERWATQLSFRGAGEICPDLCDSVSLELGDLLYSCAKLGTDPRVIQSPDEWSLQSAGIRIVSWSCCNRGYHCHFTLVESRRGQGTSKGKAGVDTTCLTWGEVTRKRQARRRVHCLPLMY